MTRPELAGIGALMLTLSALAVIMLAIPQPHDAVALADCSIPASQVAQSFLREERTFDDPSIDRIAAAERFVCHELRSPAETAGWKLQGIDAFRMQILGRPDWQVNLRYTLGTYGTSSARYLLLIVQDEESNQRVRSVSERFVEFPLFSRPALIVDSEPDSNGTVITWTQEGLRFTAELIPAEGGRDVPLRNLRSFLSSVD